MSFAFQIVKLLAFLKYLYLGGEEEKVLFHIIESENQRTV